MKNSVSLAAVAILASALQLSAQERISLDGDRIAIYNVAGEVRIEPGRGENVVVEITRGGRDGGALRVDRTSANGWRQLIVHYPNERIVYRKLGRFSRSEFSIRDDGTFGVKNLDPRLGAERINAEAGSDRGGSRVRVTGSGSGLEAHADLRVLVPAGRVVTVHVGVGKVIASHINGDLQIDARSASIEATSLAGLNRFDTGSGSINLRGAVGDVGLHTGSGAIDVVDVRGGALVASTGSGSIEAANLNVTELALNTGSGSVTVAEADAPAARIRTGSGSIRVNRLGARNFDLNTGSGSIRVALSQDVQVGRIETGSGGVNVAIAREAGTEITIDTGSGGIDMEAAGFVVTESRKRFMRGRIGDGNGDLRVSTGSGGVSFRSM